MSTPNVIQNESSRSQLATIGMTHVFGDGSVNDLRVNYSDSTATGTPLMDNFAGTTPLTGSQVFPKRRH